MQNAKKTLNLELGTILKLRKHFFKKIKFMHAMQVGIKLI